MSKRSFTFYLITCFLLTCGLNSASSTGLASISTPQYLLTATPNAFLTPISTHNAERVQALARYGRGTITDIAWSPDGKHIGIASGLGIWLYSVQGEPRLIEHGVAVGGLAFNPDGNLIVVACSDGTVRLWETATGNEQIIFRDDTNVWSVAFSPDGKYIAAGGGSALGQETHDNWIRLWDTTSKKELFLIADGTSPVLSLTFSPDGKLLAGGEGIVKDSLVIQGVQLWTVPSGKLVTRLAGHQQAVDKVTFSPDGKLIASAGMDSTVKLWDVQTHELIVTWDSHQSFVSGIAFSPDGKMLASGSYDGTVRLWDVATKRERHTLLTDPRASNADLSFSPDGKQLAVLRALDDFVVIEVSTGDIVLGVHEHSTPLTSLAISADKKFVFAASYNNTIYRWNVIDGQKTNIWQGTRTFIFDSAFNHAVTKFASAGFGGISLVDLTTGRLINQFDTETFSIHAIIFSPDGRFLASADNGDTTTIIKLWDVSTQKLVRSFDTRSEWIQCLAFSTDGKWIASGSQEGIVKLWETTTGKELFEYDYGIWVQSMAFSLDNQLLAIGGGDTYTQQDVTIRILNLVEGKEQVTLYPNSRSVSALKFSPNGSIVVSSSIDTGISFWDVSTAKELKRFSDVRIGSGELLFTEQGDLLISVGDDGVLRLWGIP